MQASQASDEALCGVLQPFLTCPCPHLLVQVLQDAAGGVQLLQLLLLEAAALELVNRLDHALDLGLVLRGNSGEGQGKKVGGVVDRKGFRRFDVTESNDACA